MTSRDFDNDCEISMQNRYQINEMRKTGKVTQWSNFDEKTLLNQRNGGKRQINRTRRISLKNQWEIIEITSSGRRRWGRKFDAKPLGFASNLLNRGGNKILLGICLISMQNRYQIIEIRTGRRPDCRLQKTGSLGDHWKSPETKFRYKNISKMQNPVMDRLPSILTNFDMKTYRNCSIRGVGRWHLISMQKH